MLRDHGLTELVDRADRITVAVPSQPSDKDQALVDEIVRSVPGAGDDRRVRSLLAAWWRYAGVRNAAGAVVDSERFLAERSSLGLLELPVATARSVIELEFALLHNPSGMIALAPSAPVPTVEATTIVSGPAAGPIVSPSPPPVAAVSAVAVTLPADWADAEPLPAPVPVARVEQATTRREATTSRRPIVAADAEHAKTLVYAGLVVFFSLAIGVAIAAAMATPRLSLPGGDVDALVAPWRAWLAIVTGLGGIAVATVIARRRTSIRSALVGPRVGLGGLAITGLGLLGGSIVTAGAGGVILVGGAAVGALRR
jgi:hypothetical protein